MNVEETTDNLIERIDGDVVDVDRERIHDELEKFDEYSVPEDEATSSLLRKIAKENGMSVGDILQDSGGSGSDSDGDGAQHVEIANIDTADEWITVRGEVVDLWDNDTDSISQVGLIDDGTGRIRFVAWEKSGVPILVEGNAYELTPVVTDSYERDSGEVQYSINLNSATEVEMIEEEFDQQKTVEGVLVDVQSGSGLIHRDEETDRYVENESDADETYHDLRIKAVLDDGEETHQVTFGREATEELTGIDLEEAKDMAMEALDMGVVIEEMKPKILGRNYRVTGQRLGNYLAAEQFEEANEIPDLDELLVKARSM